MDKLDLSYVPLLAIAASAAIALINYFNYRLNKTLNIKNHLFTEKLKVYRELTRLLSEMILLHDKGIDILNKGTEDELTQVSILSSASEIDNKGIEIDKLIIEIYLLVPDHIVIHLRDFSEFIRRPVIGATTLAEDLANLHSADREIREKAEQLIETLREDIGTRRLNMKLTRL